MGKKSGETLGEIIRERHAAAGVDIFGYLYVGCVTSEWIDAGQMVDVNRGLSKCGIRMRVGPAFESDMKMVVRNGKKFMGAMYVPLTDYQGIGGREPCNLYLGEVLRCLE